jgi:hypothetical protein
VLLRVELPPPDLDPDEVRRVVDEVLSRAEYADTAPGPVARIWDFIQEGIGRVLEAIIGAGERNVFGTVTVTVLLVVLLVLVVWLLRGMRRDPGQDLGLSGSPGRPPREWLAEAEEHERAGRWREALRCRYRLLLARLAERGLIEEVPGRTSGEYLAEALQSLPGAAQDLRGVTYAFERVWYGSATIGAGEVGRVADAVDRIDEQARSGRVPQPAGSAAR